MKTEASKPNAGTEIVGSYITEDFLSLADSSRIVRIADTPTQGLSDHQFSYVIKIEFFSKTS